MDNQRSRTPFTFLFPFAEASSFQRQLAAQDHAPKGRADPRSPGQGRGDYSKHLQLGHQGASGEPGRADLDTSPRIGAQSIERCMEFLGI